MHVRVFGWEPVCLRVLGDVFEPYGPGFPDDQSQDAPALWRGTDAFGGLAGHTGGDETGEGSAVFRQDAYG